MPPRPKSERTLRKERLYGPPLPGAGMGLPPVEEWPDDLKLRVGTSGWAYRHWLGRLYPRDLSAPRMLSYFSRRFPTVEVNSTYYQLPEAKTFEAWREAVPPGFRFAVKAPGVITHEKRLVDVEEDVAAFVDRARLLRDRLGVLLFQFPPGFHADLPLLRALLESLPDDVRVAVELRHRSWFERDVKALLERHRVAFVAHDFSQRGSRMWRTALFAYARLHGPTGRYRGSYDVATLIQWSEQMRAWLTEGADVWTYLNNDERGHGPRNALTLRELLGEPAGASPAARRSRARQVGEA